MNINTGLPLPFLLIKLTPLISISSVTEMSVFLRRLYSTDWFLIVFAWRAKKTSECEANVCARLFPECDYILAVWVGVRKVASADNRSVFILLCIGKNSSRYSQGTETRHVFCQFWASFGGIKLANNQPAEALFCFPAFLPDWFKNISGLWSQI